MWLEESKMKPPIYHRMFGYNLGLLPKLTNDALGISGNRGVSY